METRVRLRPAPPDEAQPTGWSAEQRAVLAHAAGPLLVLGGPGTGKTALIIELAAQRLVAGQSPALVVALTRRAASELRDRVVRLAGRAQQPSVTTVHSLCLALLARFADPEDAPPRLLTAPEQEFRIRELLAGRGPDAWPRGLTEAHRTGAFARQVRAALARARHLGLDPDDLVRFGREAGDESWAALGSFMEEYLEVLDLEQVLDYAELVHRTRLLLESPQVADAVRAGFGAVYVDDLAELDPAQLALVRALAGDTRPVVGFADPDAAIYRFRGAHPRAAAAFRELFAPPGGRVPVATLTRSFRCPDAVVAATRGVAGRLGVPGMEAGLVRTYRDLTGAGAGRVQVWTFANEADQARRIASELRAAHLEEGLAWGDMAVLVRSGRAQIPRLARALTDVAIPVEVAGDEIGLAGELAVRPLLLALEVAARGGECDADEAHRLLTSGWGGLDAVALRRIGRALRGRAATPEEAGRPAGELIARSLSAAGDDVAPVEDAAATPALGVVADRRSLLARAALLVADGRRPEEVLWLLWSGTPWPSELRRAALGPAEGARRAHRALDAVVALFTLAAGSQAGGGAGGVRAFLAEVANQQIPADLEREAAAQGRGVRILTAHRAKGRQWPFVVVAGAQEGVWPDVQRRGSVFDPEMLSNGGLGQGVVTRDLVATERRLFHLACTRASGRLLVTAVAGTEGEADQPSRFLAELGVAAVPTAAHTGRLHTLVALVASLRSAVVDPGATPELRAGAAARLAALADARDDGGAPLGPDADPARWWGVRRPSGPERVPVTGEIVLSPSQLSSILACPRKYYLEREVRAEPVTPTAAVLGSVIHALAEHVARDGLDQAAASAWLDEVWNRIPFAAAWLPASERVEAELAITRLLNWQEAHAGAEVVGVEVPFEFTLEVGGRTVRVRGTVDRLERLPSGALRVIDFKSSRRVPSKAEAAAHEQLGLYQLAVEQGAFAEIADGARESAGGALVFLRAGDEAAPKVLGQDALRTTPHLGDDPDERTHPTWVHHRVARACDTLAGGRWDACPGQHCDYCPFAGSCPAKAAGRQVVS